MFPFSFGRTLVPVLGAWLMCVSGVSAINDPALTSDDDQPVDKGRSPIDESHVAEFRIAGYLPDYRLASFDPAQAAELTDLMVFSAEPAADGRLNLNRLAQAPWDQFQKLHSEHHVRIMLSIGGWERSHHFAAVAASVELRRTFVADVLATCQRLQLDGIDLDWEHPSGDAESQNYAHLLKDLRTSFAGTPHQLSVTIAGWQSLSADAVAAVDWINVMAYDHAGRHSTFENATREVQSLIDRGVPAEKLTFGLPFYGRGTTDRSRTLTWREIAEKHNPATSIDEIDGLYFNGPDTIRRKTRFALEHELAGVMFWELGQDASGDASLLKVIAEEAAQASTTPADGPANRSE